MKDILNAHLTELVNSVNDGDTSPLEAWFEMKQMLDKVKWSMGLIEDAAINERAVSYTHLTLPTKRIV